MLESYAIMWVGIISAVSANYSVATLKTIISLFEVDERKEN